jgi:NTP pyrophosphatase (non-canonical NTP hydrolase)
MEISEFQKLISDLYGSRDKKRGLEKTTLWLVEEVGELAEAVRRGSLKLVKEEIADVIAWTVSIANVMGIDVEEALNEKYPGKCHRCNSCPCRCPED